MLTDILTTPDFCLACYLTAGTQRGTEEGAQHKPLVPFGLSYADQEAAEDSWAEVQARKGISC